MANLKEIRTRITSVKSTKQITSAMKMVSAAKLRKAQDAITQMRPYANKLHEILTHISSGLEGNDDNTFAQKREDNKVALIVINSNRGLCGAFNSNVVKTALHIAKTKYSKLYEQGQIDFYSIGKKSSDLLKSKNIEVVKNFSYLYDNLNFRNVSEVANEFMQAYDAGIYNEVVLIYNKFKNAATQILTEEVFLPVTVETDTENTPDHDFIFEPSNEYIVDVLVPKSLKIQFFKALLDSHAAEHGARMTAMHKATDNADELIKELRLYYNKARQASITAEILEIVGGAEALNG